MDKCHLLSSPLGMISFLRGDYIISVLRDDGSLDEGKVREIFSKIQFDGANGIREFPFWAESQKEMDAIQFNTPKYFDMIRRIAEIAKSYNLNFWFSLYDHCGTKFRIDSQPGKYNYWRKYKNYFYDLDSLHERNAYIAKTINAFEGLDNIYYDLCNEPAAGHGRFLGETFIQLISLGIDARRISLGIDYGLKESNYEYEKDYRNFREYVNKKLPGNWSEKLKTHCYSPFHGLRHESLNMLWKKGVRPGGDRNIIYSFDGTQPRKFSSEVQDICERILAVKRKGALLGRVIFEAIYGKKKGDPINAIQGASEAYYKFFKEYPTNYGKKLGPKPKTDIDNKYDIIAAACVDAILGENMRQNIIDCLSKNIKLKNLNVKGACEYVYEFAAAELSKLTHAERVRRAYGAVLKRDVDENSKKEQEENIKEIGICAFVASLIKSDEFKNKILGG